MPLRLHVCGRNTGAVKVEEAAGEELGDEEADDGTRSSVMTAGSGDPEPASGLPSRVTGEADGVDRAMGEFGVVGRAAGEAGVAGRSAGDAGEAGGAG